MIIIFTHNYQVGRSMQLMTIVATMSGLLLLTMSNNIQQYFIIIMIDDDDHDDHDLHQVQLHVQHHSGQWKPSTRMRKSRYSTWGAFGKTYDGTGTLWW